MFAYVGCRTTRERNARGKGINVYHVDGDSGKWTHLQLIDALENPSFLEFDRSGRYLYSIHGDGNQVSSFAVNRSDGRLTFINCQATEGRNPVHLVPDRSNKFLIIANYATGSLANLPIHPDGSLGSVVDLAELSGEPGPHKTQQSSSHPHDVVFDRSQQFIIVPDKGLDRVFAFAIDSSIGKFKAAPAAGVATREGAGPRHVSFHPTRPLAYVINELDSTITTYHYDESSAKLTPLQIVPTIPDNYTGNNTGAEICVSASGQFVFASNRGHDSVATFSIDPQTGWLSPVSWSFSGGKGPRFFAIDPREEFLYAANENSDTIVAFRIDKRSGHLNPTGNVIHTGSPVCVAFLDSEQRNRS